MEIITQNMGYIITALVILVALILAMIIFRSFGGRVRSRRGSRLGVSEYYDIDNDRQLLLVRRDDREHLILIGGNQDIVIESGIDIESTTGHQDRLHRGAPRRESLSRDEGDDTENRPIPLRPTPRPAVFGERGPVLRPVGRDEPKLGVVSASDDDK